MRTTTVDDVREFLDEGWTVLLWRDDKGSYHAFVTHTTEITRHPTGQEKHEAKGRTPSEAVCYLVEKMGGRSIATGTLLEVAGGLVEWDAELERVGCHTRPPRVIVDKARAVLELAKWKRK